MEYVEIIFILNGTTGKKNYSGETTSCQILDGVGHVRFASYGTDIETGRQVKVLLMRQCEMITKYVE